MNEELTTTDAAHSEAAGVNAKLQKGRFFTYMGLGMVIAGPIMYSLFMDQAFLRSTGVIAWIFMLDGIVMATMGAMWTRRRSSKIIAGTSVALTAAFAFFFFVFAKLPQPAGLLEGKPVPDLAIRDHTGTEVQLASMWNKGPVLFVFYRGHW